RSEERRVGKECRSRGAGDSKKKDVSGVDGFFGFGGGVGWGRGLAAEGGGEENGEGVAWAHSASPLGEGEENTGAAERWQAATGPSQLGESSSFAPFFFSSRRRHTRSVSAFLLNRSSD